MIKHLARTGAVLTLASLLLTACSGNRQAPAEPSAEQHPVFGKEGP
ncbi:hypothetical protein [Streptomyces sp. MNU103]|nr:hypothetical protein [Streptomyces sp. MNU103]